jgi:SAM-dependent methyltransferase
VIAPHETPAATTTAFDRLAPDYDALTGGEIFRLLRARTHGAFARSLDRRTRVLEIGCGTGLDTVFLASRGHEVIACDPSEEMVTRTLRRLARHGLDARATVMPCGLEDVQTYLDALAPHEPFDAIVSNFGALNCVCHLAPLGALARRHLRPGGSVLLGLMTRMCALEAAACDWLDAGLAPVPCSSRWPESRCPLITTAFARSARHSAANCGYRRLRGSAWPFRPRISSHAGVRCRFAFAPW